MSKVLPKFSAHSVGSATKREAIQRLLAPFEESGITSKVIDAHRVRNVVWIVREWMIGTKIWRAIECNEVVFEQSRGLWGFITVSEEKHPSHVNCPIGFFRLVSQSNKAWREQVRAHHERRLVPTQEGAAQAA